MTTKPPMLAADHIRDLVKGFTTYEVVKQPTKGKDGRWRPEARIHAVTHKPLLNQLEDAITGASARADEDAGHSSFTSKPAAHLEAVDVLAMIDRESLEYAVDLGLQAPPRTRTVVPVTPLRHRLLDISGHVGLTESRPVQRWWVSARLATQWDQRPFQPNGAPCLNCWHVKTLRIDVGNHLARCIECHETWDGPGPVAVLAQHVKWCTDHEVTKPRHWAIDDHGELVECMECLTFRSDYQAWRFEQQVAERHAQGGAHVDSVA